MSDPRTLRGALPIVIGAGVMLSLAMGIRQCFGLFVTPLTKDIAVSVSEFTLALSIQNLAWGFLQPVAGALIVRLGFRPILLTGAVLYLAGLAVMAAAQGVIGLIIGAGLLIGLSLACTASAMAMAAVSRAVPERIRSTLLGIITGVGSLGALLAAPLSQSVIAAAGWRAGVLAILVLALGLLPAAWFASRADAIVVPRATNRQLSDELSALAAVRTAFTRVPFVIMTTAYFVCGMQLLFVAVHLPSYLTLCGIEPMVSAEALMLIAIFNVFGSVFFGWAGGRWSKLFLLGGIYGLRSLVLAAYFALPPTPTSTLVFAAAMGFLWLGVGPLVAGSVIEMFGLRWQAMVQGLAFMSHQLGSFVGAFGGGVVFDALGSYTLAWQIAVLLGLTAGIVQMIAAIARPTGLARSGPQPSLP
jgi:predicted MFS family arabinose efflux permease